MIAAHNSKEANSIGHYFLPCTSPARYLDALDNLKIDTTESGKPIFELVFYCERAVCFSVLFVLVADVTMMIHTVLLPMGRSHTVVAVMREKQTAKTNTVPGGSRYGKL